MSHAIQPTPTLWVSLRSYLTSPIGEPSDTSVTFMYTRAKHFSRKDFLVMGILSILKKSVELSMKIQARPSLILLLKLMNGQSKQNASQLDPWDKVGESRDQRDAARSWQAGVVRYINACKHFEKMGESVLNWKFLYFCSHSERLELAHLHLDTVVWESTLVKNLQTSQGYNTYGLGAGIIVPGR